MLQDIPSITATNASRQHIHLLPTTANEEFSAFVGNQNRLIDRFQLFASELYLLRFPEPRWSETYQTMLASEQVLQRDWEQPEEDAAWADL